ncbi:MAG TPA: flagellar biosynthesis anti-sigma factor FlgM [Methylibium sp.]|nr:flagellar biosynthesis anti-sigma factor FlgM [Methylibium sp.]
MKIGPTSSPAADAAALLRANAEAGAAAAKARGAQDADAASAVHLSSTAAGLLADATAPEFDAAKVERMKQAIADGSFKVNAEVIADKLIANAQELLGSVKR